MSSINITSLAQIYLSEFKKAADGINLDDIQKVADLLFNAYNDNNTVFVMGNGGSASTASHMACDLGKGTLQNVYNQDEKRLKVISITDNVATITAFANDLAYDEVFSQQLHNLIMPKDILIGISASGNSPNILRALKYAKERGATTIGFFGHEGGKAKQLVNVDITINSNNFGVIEDLHLTLNHLITTCLTFMKKRKDSGK